MQALLVGNSDGIGLTTSRKLLARGWQVAGISRSASPIEDAAYVHVVSEVQVPGYRETLQALLDRLDPLDLCIYCAGVGELLDPSDMDREVEIVDVNLLGMLRTAARVIPPMVARGRGHFIGISSLADAMRSPQAPSYHASKAGLSCYLESLALALAPRGVHVTNVRFGFVDTKMAKGDFKPFMLDVDRAAEHLLACIDERPIRHTAPRIAIPLVRLRSCLLELEVLRGAESRKPK
ncbi:MAG: SDR family NAD(P)-dependent oxidoreductase [Deltaproteobacteria bacterium]|nr:SDR family NAD(P)-dependent oxidoreductase [Deltaproteobacteria bacterium]